MKPTQKIVVTITNRTIVRAIFWVIVAILGYHFIGRVSHILTLIFASAFLAMALNPIVSWMSRRLRTKSRVRAPAAGYIVVVGFLIAFFAIVTPPLVRQTRDFIRDVPKTVANFQHQDTSLARAARRYHIDQRLTESANNFTSHYGNFGSAVLNTTKRIVEAIASVLAVLVMTFMMLVEGPRWLELLWGVTSERRRVRHQRVAHKIYRAVTGFVNGQVILAAVAGVFAFTALEIASHVIGVSINAVALAGIVAVFGVIPLFGNPISSTLVILVSLLTSTSLAVIMLIYFVIYYILESHTFQPYLQSKLNDLTPLTVFVSALLGIGFGGILGAIVAIPAAATVKIFLEDYFEQKRHRVPEIEKTSL